MVTSSHLLASLRIKRTTQALPRVRVLVECWGILCKALSAPLSCLYPRLGPHFFKEFANLTPPDDEPLDTFPGYHHSPTINALHFRSPTLPLKEARLRTPSKSNPALMRPTRLPGLHLVVVSPPFQSGQLPESGFLRLFPACAKWPPTPPAF